MKKLFLCALAGTLYLTAIVSQAADVNLYGKVDTALHIQKNRGENAVLSITDEASRIGLRIREKLSSEWSVKGYLENGFSSDSGQFSNIGGGNKETTLFDRRSILALSSSRYGELGFGRMGSIRSTISPYSLVMGYLDPMETGYGDIASISNMFGNDPRGNNTATWVSPLWAGLQVGVTGSLAATDQEQDHSSQNTRLLSVGGNYMNGSFGIYAGATRIWFGEGNSASADKGQAWERQDAAAYIAGITWKPTDNWKLFLAGQYQKDWRNVAGWNIDSGNGLTAYDAANGDRKHGIDGWNGLAGFQYWPTKQLRLIVDAVYFDGSHEMGDGSSLDAKRTVVNTAAEYSLSKTTKVYATLSRSWAREEINTDKLNTWISHIGLQHWF